MDSAWTALGLRLDSAWTALGPLLFGPWAQFSKTELPNSRKKSNCLAKMCQFLQSQADCAVMHKTLRVPPCHLPARSVCLATKITRAWLQVAFAPGTLPAWSVRASWTPCERRAPEITKPSGPRTQGELTFRACLMFVSCWNHVCIIVVSLLN